jgi:hypothetical protein
MVAWLRCAHLKTLAVHHIGIPDSVNHTPQTWTRLAKASRIDEVGSDEEAQRRSRLYTQKAKLRVRGRADGSPASKPILPKPEGRHLIGQFVLTETQRLSNQKSGGADLAPGL